MAKVIAALRRGTGISSRLIAWWGNGYNGYSHVDLVMPDGTYVGARDDAVGGKPPGVWPRPADYERDKIDRLTLVEIPCEQAQADAAYFWVRNQIGSDYDPDDIIRLITDEPIAARAGHWICSALFTGTLLAGKILAPGPVPPQQVTPDGVVLTCWGLGAKFFPQVL